MIFFNPTARDDALFKFDFFDPISNDLPKGSWSIQVDSSKTNVKCSFFFPLVFSIIINLKIGNCEVTSLARIHSLSQSKLLDIRICLHRKWN